MERHSSDDALLTAHAGLQGLCHALEDPVAVVALPQGAVLEVNRAFRRAFGVPDPLPERYSLLDLSGPGLGRTLRTWDRTKPRVVPRAALKGVEGRLVLVPVPGASPPQAFVHFIPRGGGPPDRLKELLDRRLEEIRNFERLRSLGEVAAVIVHELRTPLASIRFALEGARKELGPGTPPRRRLDVALEQVERLDRLLSGIRHFSRPVVLAPRRIDVRDTISTALRGVEGMLQGPQTTVTVEVKPDPLSILADPERLVEALQNVVVNAIEAMPQGGLVSIAAAPSRRRRGGVEIRVTDRGPGIPAAAMEKLFHPFFTTKPGGTGLGLSIVKKVVDMHGGLVSVKTGEGKGTTVVLELPGADSA